MIVSIKTNLQKQDCIWSTKTSISQAERDRAIDNFLNENDDKKNKNKFHHPTFENSSIDLSIHSESCEDLHVKSHIEDDHVVISMLHPLLGTKRRLFRGGAKMNSVYD